MSISVVGLISPSGRTDPIPLTLLLALCVRPVPGIGTGVSGGVMKLDDTTGADCAAATLGTACTDGVGWRSMADEAWPDAGTGVLDPDALAPEAEVAGGGKLAVTSAEGVVVGTANDVATEDWLRERAMDGAGLAGLGAENTDWIVGCR